MNHYKQSRKQCFKEILTTWWESNMVVLLSTSFLKTFRHSVFEGFVNASQTSIFKTFRVPDNKLVNCTITSKWYVPLLLSPTFFHWKLLTVLLSSKSTHFILSIRLIILLVIKNRWKHKPNIILHTIIRIHQSKFSMKFSRIEISLKPKLRTWR